MSEIKQKIQQMSDSVADMYAKIGGENLASKITKFDLDCTEFLLDIADSLSPDNQLEFFILSDERSSFDSNISELKRWVDNEDMLSYEEKQVFHGLIDQIKTSSDELYRQYGNGEQYNILVRQHANADPVSLEGLLNQRRAGSQSSLSGSPVALHRQDAHPPEEGEGNSYKPGP